MLIYVFLDAQRILHRAQGEQLIDTGAGKPGLRGLCAGGEDQLVVALLEFHACLQIFYGDGFAFRLDSRDLMTDFHDHTEAGEKALRGLESQLFRIPDHVADIVGQTAVGIGDISGTLKHNDLRRLVQPPDSCRGCSASRHAAYNYHFHVIPPFHDMRPCRRYCSRLHTPYSAAG